MKLHADHLEGVNAISRCGAESITVNGKAWAGSIIVPWRGQVMSWACPLVAQLRAEHFDLLLSLNPELVIFGSGPSLQFPPPEALQALMTRRIGVEAMDTAAACRTYAVLASEGRRVVAALRLTTSDDRA